MHDERRQLPGPVLARLLRRRLARTLLNANLLGGVVAAVVLFGFFFGREPGERRVHLDAAVALVVAYLAVAGWATARDLAARGPALWGWLAQEREPQPAERDRLLAEPRRTAARVGWTWLGAAAVLGAVEAAGHTLHRGFDVALTITLGGLTTAAIAFLLTERVLRPAVARALTARSVRRAVGPGVTARLVLVWLLATGVPLLGLGLMGVVALVLDEYSRRQLAAAALILSAVAFGAGLAATALVAGGLGHSVTAVTDALERVRGGRLDAAVQIDDGSEVGLLQAGFNEMAAGLRERERMRDLFGRHVGEEVARAALAGNPELGGEVRDVAALFVDINGSTALAASRPPQEVVELINRFFAVVVDVVAAHGGLVNKFEGDAALCVFGAPLDQPDHADRALATARALRSALREAVPQLDAGIGVSGGPAVAGNVGAERRYEYTVIGDPVNAAARLCELAKLRPQRVLAAAEVLERASPGEAARWRFDGEQVLRGRRSPTRLAVPA